MLFEVTYFILQVVEAPGASRCIGPGCTNVAQPDSVYCSNDCILKHAAATMKFLSSGKEQKPKPKEKTKMKPEKLILPKCSVQVSQVRPLLELMNQNADECKQSVGLIRRCGERCVGLVVSGTNKLTFGCFCV